MNKEIQYDASVDAQMEDRSRVEIIRDETQRVSTQYGERGRITGYTYYISIRNKPALSGNLTREEMDLMYRLYSNEGDNLTQRSIARLFPHITFQDFKRILKAFNITKASAPIAPHLIEEKSTDELVMLHHQNDETKFLRRIEQDREKQTEKQLKEFGDKLPAEKKKPIEDALTKLKEAHKSQNVAAIDTAMAELNTIFQAASQEMYSQGQAGQPGPGAQDAGQAQRL